MWLGLPLLLFSSSHPQCSTSSSNLSSELMIAIHILNLADIVMVCKLFYFSSFLIHNIRFRFLFSLLCFFFVEFWFITLHATSHKRQLYKQYCNNMCLHCASNMQIKCSIYICAFGSRPNERTNNTKEYKQNKNM